MKKHFYRTEQIHLKKSQSITALKSSQYHYDAVFPHWGQVEGKPPLISRGDEESRDADSRFRDASVVMREKTHYVVFSRKISAISLQETREHSVAFALAAWPDCFSSLTSNPLRYMVGDCRCSSLGPAIIGNNILEYAKIHWNSSKRSVEKRRLTTTDQAPSRIQPRLIESTRFCHNEIG